MKFDPKIAALYSISIIGSGCGFLSQILVSGYWSAAFSQDVFFFSINSAFYFLSLGLGSLYTPQYRQPSRSLLLTITALLCLWTGVSIEVMEYIIRNYEPHILIPISIVSVSGFLSGQIIPITLSLKSDSEKLNLPTLFFLDYTAAILFTLLFTFVLLIPLGYSKTALSISYTGTLFLLFTAFILKVRTPAYGISTLLSLILPIALFLAVDFKGEAPRIKNKELSAKVLLNKQSYYQKIILTEEVGNNSLFPNLVEHVLYLDGQIQFNSQYEQAYHYCLANIPGLASTYIGHTPKRALILGGGDGLAARNVLTIPGIEHVDQVELDPEVLHLARTDARFTRINHGSLNDKRVNVITADAFHWVRGARQSFYDLIVIDFPDPKNVTLARLYSSEFYYFVWKLLSPKGFLSIQAGPIFALVDENLETLSRVPTSVMKTLASIGQQSYVYFNPRDLDAFVLATPNEDFDMLAFSQKIKIEDVGKRFNVCKYRRLWRVPPVETNTLNSLPITQYMLDWYEMAGRSFRYQGNYAIFLPK